MEYNLHEKDYILTTMLGTQMLLMTKTKNPTHSISCV